jgi:hypothetical protein
MPEAATETENRIQHGELITYLVCPVCESLASDKE